MKVVKLHQLIDRSMPKMQCDHGCGDCCGVAPCSEAEYQRVMNFASEHDIVPLRQGSTCPFYWDGTCAVYEVRPGICRLFGHSPDLVCSRGYNTNIDPRAEAVLSKEINEHVTRAPRILHQCVYGPDEFTEIVRAECERGQPVMANGKQIGKRPSNKAYHAARALGYPMCVDQTTMPLEAR